MLAHRKQKLMIVAFIVLGAALAAGLMTYAFRQGINVYFTPTEVAQGAVPQGQQFRIGGMVKNGSLDKSGGVEGTTILFVTTDCVEDIPVTYTGVLPDLFREGQGVVADGYLDDTGLFQATTILAKHDENYMSAEVKNAMDEAGITAEECMGMMDY